MRRKKAEPKETETDPRFPTGKWTGFWLQELYLGRQWMSLQLTFAGGAVQGDGADCVGDFRMSGTYDLATGFCRITKAYIGGHTVVYEGRNQDDGMWIWGVWRIGSFDRGGFHLWPAWEKDPTGRRLADEKQQPQPHVRLEPAEEPVAV